MEGGRGGNYASAHHDSGLDLAAEGPFGRHYTRVVFIAILDQATEADTNGTLQSRSDLKIRGLGPMVSCRHRLNRL